MVSIASAAVAIIRAFWAVVRHPVATHWWPPNDKPTFVLTALTAVAASTFAALTYRLNRAQGIPILTLRAEATEIENIGKGPALNTCFTDSRGHVLRFIGSVAAGERRAVHLNVTFDMHSKYRLYYHDAQRGLIRRRMWRRSTVFRRSFGPGHREEFVNDFSSKSTLFRPRSAVRRRCGRRGNTTSNLLLGTIRETTGGAFKSRAHSGGGARSADGTGGASATSLDSMATN
jgi:hypothetical protein